MKIDPAALRERAARNFSSTPRPFIRWAGSKRALLGNIVDLLPAEIRVYHEPFLGSAALFFLIQPHRANLGDACRELIATYETVAANATEVLDYLIQWKPDRDRYYSLRDGCIPENPVYAAARFIYLNKTCWNGLYRVNALGKFNVPYGRPKTDNLIDRDNLLACAKVLVEQTARLSAGDFSRTLRNISEGDFVFLDPPYVTRHNENGFIEYNERIFSWQDQQRLADIAQRLVHKGANVMVTNAMHSDILELYKGFNVIPVERSSTIASDNRRRGRVVEAIIFRYPEV